MKNTRQHILDTARHLFNENGYSNVTIRNIAREMGISSGNLNYHFKQREDILEALYFEMTSVLDARLEDAFQKDYDLQMVIDGMVTSMSKMVDYRFIWSDLFYLMQSQSKMKKHFYNTIKVEHKTWNTIILKLKENKLIQDNLSEDRRKILTQRIVDFANTWIYTSILYKTKTLNQKFVRSQAEYLIRIFEPYLSKKGKKELQDILST